jgi:succinate-acetate transporter protein
MNKKLQITLYVIAVYLTIFGILFLFAPRVAEMILSAKLPDAALNMLYGQLTLTFAFLAWLAARGGDGVSKRARSI